VEINYFKGRLNPKSYWVVIGLAGGFGQICGGKFSPQITLARAIVVGSADGSFGRSMGKFKRGLAEEPVLGNIHHQKKRQDKQQGVLNGGLRSLLFLTFLRVFYPMHMQNHCQEIILDNLLFCYTRG
jgi:hypothetical protein